MNNVIFLLISNDCLLNIQQEYFGNLGSISPYCLLVIYTINLAFFVHNSNI